MEKLKPGEREKLVAEKTKYLENAGLAMQNEMVAFQKKHAKFFTETLELYKLLNKPDALFDDSPLSSHTIHRWFRLYLVKIGMGFIVKDTPWLDGVNEIPTFAQKMKELSNWTSKFSYDDPPELSGEEKILKRGGN